MSQPKPTPWKVRRWVVNSLGGHELKSTRYFPNLQKAVEWVENMPCRKGHILDEVQAHIYHDSFLEPGWVACRSNRGWATAAKAYAMFLGERPLHEIAARAALLKLAKEA